MNNNNNEIVVGVEVTLKTPDSFLIVKESLTRMGLASKHSKTLFQTAHILHRKGQYFIVHFKELFILDGRNSDIVDEDYRRRNSITKLLNSWGLCQIVNPLDIEFLSEPGSIKVVPHKEKKEWELVPKYTIGNRKHENN